MTQESVAERVAADETTGVRVLQRVILPVDRDLDVLPLYVEAKPTPGQEATARDAPTDGAVGRQSVGTQAAEPQPDAAGEAYNPENLVGRHGVVVPLGRRVSFCTYFNAFPAGYWRRWTSVDEVRLRLRLRGEATVIVYRSTSKGHTQRVESIHVQSDAEEQHEFALSLKPFIDGGWYWFEIAAGKRSAVLERAEWCAKTDRLRAGRLSIGITTFNRPDFCVDQLRKLGEAEDVLELVDEVFVVDQGTRRVEDHPDCADAAKALGGRLRIIEQGNLGGSGGFSRAMAETVETGQSDYVLLLDDDVVTEPEGILRGLTFADLADQPTIVGGQMFSLYDRSVLHAYGETVNRYRFFWGAAPNTLHGHNFSANRLRTTKWLHRRIDVDYNGWWMCLIPTQVVREVGLALPFFIKWDDCEYGLRARQAGYLTVTLPGMAVWHVPWHEKDDTVDWQAYFHCRNRFVGALLHSPYPYGGRLVRESSYVFIKHLLCMQYSAAELMVLAMEDLLSGPGHMHPEILGKMAQIRSLRARFTDAQTRGDLKSFPIPSRRKPPRRGKEVTAPGRRVAVLKTAAIGAVRQALPVHDSARHHPEAAVPHIDQKWWLLSQFDSALASTADGTGAAWVQRDPERFRTLLARGAALHARLLADWPRLRDRYRAAVPDLSSPARWRETFEASRSPES